MVKIYVNQFMILSLLHLQKDCPPVSDLNFFHCRILCCIVEFFLYWCEIIHFWIKLSLNRCKQLFSLPLIQFMFITELIRYCFVVLSFIDDYLRGAALAKVDIKIKNRFSVKF